jgi:uncharacterized protein with von Willebrand factor type A (vWA) domain
MTTMDREGILAELENSPGGVSSDDDAGGRAAMPPSPTALNLDAWSIRRGEESLEGDVLGPILKGQVPDDVACHAAADFLASVFEPSPVLNDTCEDNIRLTYLRQLLDTEEYRGLHADTQLDVMASELAAGHFAMGYVSLVEDEKKESPKLDGGKYPSEGRDDGDIRKEIRALAAAAVALNGASKDVDDLREAQRSLGGDGAVEGGTASLADIRERFGRIRDSRTLRKIMELAGRYRRMAQAKQRQKAMHGMDDTVGVEIGADLGRLLPSELLSLTDPDLELDALRRFIERGMLQREYRAVEPVGQGPIVVVVDESGSMDGNPIAHAKAFALAMGWIARHQHRWLALVGFSGRRDCNCLILPPGRWDQGALLDWMEHFYGGGSDRDVPLKELPAVWPSLGCPEGKTDIIQITDAICDVSKEMADSFVAWKRRIQAKYYTIVIGHGGPGDLQTVSDKVWVASGLGIDGEAVQELMGI